MTKRFEAHIHCGDGGEHYHDGIIDNLDKSKQIFRNYHSISVIMNNIWEQTQRFEKHNQKLEKVYGSLIDENEQLKIVINRYEKDYNKKNDELNFRQLDILKLKEENKQLKKENKEFKALLDEMSDCNNEIWLDDGRIYRLKRIFVGKWNWR